MQIKNILNSRLTAVAVGGAVIAVLGSTAGFAAASITSADIANETIRSKDVMNGTLKPADLSDAAKQSLEGERGAQGAAGQNGADGADGKDGYEGAFYAVAFYDVGNTNSGAPATVACSATSSDFTAVAGGAQTLGLDDTPLDNNTPVSSSFPGRMDWSTNSPLANRLDGWVVQFAGTSANRGPRARKVWALCLPTTNVPVVETFTLSV